MPPGGGCGYTLDMADAPEKACWYNVTPGRLLPVLLVAEGFLWLSQRFQWFAFNHHKGWTVLVALAAVGAFLVLMFLWFLLALVFRWRFQFSILSLFVLTVVMALPFSWLATEMKAARKQREAAEGIGKAGGYVIFDYQEGLRITLSHSGTTVGGTPPGPLWLRKLLGVDLFASATQASLNSTGISDAGLERFRWLPTLQTLDLIDTKVSDAGLEHLRRIDPAPRSVPQRRQSRRRRAGTSQGIDAAPNAGDQRHGSQRRWTETPQRIGPTPHAGARQHESHRCRAGTPQRVDQTLESCRFKTCKSAMPV